MKRVVASIWMCWAAFCGTQSNTAPLAFGMTPEEASIALGVPLVYHSGKPGSEIYLAYGSRRHSRVLSVRLRAGATVPQRPADRLEEGLALAPPMAVLKV